MIEHGFNRTEYDWCVYFKVLNKTTMIYLLLYVDDMLIACKYKCEVIKLKKQLRKRFQMKDLGPKRRTLGMEIFRSKRRRSYVYNKELLIQST